MSVANRSEFAEDENAFQKLGLNVICEMARILDILNTGIGGFVALTIGLAEARNNFSSVTAEVNKTGRSVTVLKNNKPWVVIKPVAAAGDSEEEALDVAIDFMDEYADVFNELDK